MQATDGIAMMFGVHGSEEVGGGFVMRFFLSAAPMQAQAVAETAKHSHYQHRMGLAHPAKVVVMGDIQTLVQAAFDAPSGAVVSEPLGGAEFLRRQARHQCHHFGAMMAKLAAQEGDLFHARKVHPLGGRGLRTQNPDFQPAFVDLTRARQLCRGLPRGGNPPAER